MRRQWKLGALVGAGGLALIVALLAFDVATGQIFRDHRVAFEAARDEPLYAIGILTVLAVQLIVSAEKKASP